MTNVGRSEQDDVDVIVIGSGAAGLSAALEAANCGVRVLVAEASRTIGGSSRLSGGIVMGAETSIQAARGIEDSVLDLYHEYMAFNSWEVSPSLAMQLARGGGQAVDWLIRLGVEFARSPMIGGEERVPRSHVPRGMGQEIIDVLARECRARGVEFALDRRVDHLLKDEATGAVCGVSVGEDDLTSGALVIASGGFGANAQMLNEYFPTAMRDESWTWYIGSPDAKGDAIKLGRSVNADLCGFGRGLVLLTPNFQRELEAYLPGWLLLTDDKGDRLCNETLSSGVLQRIVENCGGRVFAIFDETARLDAVPEGQGEYRGRLPGGAPWPQSPNFNSVTIAEQVGRGLVASETSVAGLAEVLSLPPARLEATVDRYMAAVCAGVDDDFGKESRFLRPIEKPPFYGVPLQLASVALTGTGLRIDARANVLNQNGRPIPNVYAAGECAGGVIGPRYMGNGNSWASCLTFGRIAGRNAGLRMAAKNVG